MRNQTLVHPSIGRTALAVLTGSVVALGAGGAGPAQAAGCTKPVMTSASGLGIVEIRKSGVSCTVARRVAKRAVSSQSTFVRSSFTTGGSRWRCRITQNATGTDPGLIARTKVRCTSGKRVVRFQLAS